MGIRKTIRDAYHGVLAAVDNTEDTDKVFSYYTRQQVCFLDAKLGLTAILIQVGIAVFIVAYIFIHKEGYLEMEQAKGAVVTHVFGDAVSESSGQRASRFFSIEDITYPGLENGNIFIATRQVVHRQMRGTCADPDMPCLSDSDCSPLGNGRCNEAGLCEERSWCSVEKEPEIYALASDQIQIWARSFIQYVKLAPGKLFDGAESKVIGPHKGNTFTVRQLLMMCKPIPINFEEVAELGAVIEVGFRYECNVRKSHCEPIMNVRRVDTIFDPDNIGFSFKHPEYVDDDHRLQNEVRGLRFFFRTSGVGKKWSVAAIITNASTSSTLLAFAVIVADLLLTRVFARKKKYNARKFEQTPDFSEWLEIAEAQKESRVKDADIDKLEQKVLDREALWMETFNEET